MARTGFDAFIATWSPAIGITIICAAVITLGVREIGNTYYGRPRKGFGIKLDIASTVLVLLLATIVVLRFAAFT